MYNGTQMDYTISITSGLTRQVSFYCLDFDNLGRTLRIEVRDLTNNALLDSRTVSGFGSGIYMVWNVAGSVKFQVYNTGGQNAAISGLFFDAPGTVDNPPPPTNLNATPGNNAVNLAWQGVGQAAS